MFDNSLSNNQLLYRQVEEKIRAAISSGHWKVGTRIPSENELSRSFGVSRVTLRTAISNLEKEGLLLKLQGKGTYITSRQYLSNNYHRMQSFTDLCRIQQRTASAKVIFSGLRKPEEMPRKFLSIAQDEDAYVIERVRLVDHIPILVESVTFKYSYLFLQEEDLTKSLYTILKSYNIIPDKGIKTVGIYKANEFYSKHLNIPEGTALLVSNAMVLNDKSDPIHYVKQIIRADLPEIFKYYV
jgi:GntR family transcriptional regulator